MTTCPHCACDLSWTGETLHMRCVSCGSMVFRPVAAGAAVILLVHDNGHAAETLGDLMVCNGFDVVHVREGTQALALAGMPHLAGVVIDAALDGGFALIDRLRAQPNGRALVVLLVATVHNVNAYKRPPSKLYGADDYLELHRAPEVLLSKLQTHLMAHEKNVRDGSHFSGTLRVRALAHSIVADLALAHQPALEHAVQSGDLQQLEPALQEGRRLLAEMVGRDLGVVDPVGEVFGAFLDEMRRVSA